MVVDLYDFAHPDSIRIIYSREQVKSNDQNAFPLYITNYEIAGLRLAHVIIPPHAHTHKHTSPNSIFMSHALLLVPIHSPPPYLLFLAMVLRALPFLNHSIWAEL